MQNHTATEIDEYRRQIASIRSEATRLAAPLTEEQFGWHPAPGVWSVGDCLDHLNLFGSQVEENIREMLAETVSRGLRKEGPYRHGLLGSLLVKLVEPPYRILFRAVRRLVPPSTTPKGQVVPAFFALQDRLDGLLQEAEGLDLAAVRRPLPPTNLKLTLGQWFGICLAHERRHLWQAAQIRSLPGFPGQGESRSNLI